MERLQRLIAALWFGSAVFLMLSSSAAFRAAGNATTAADVVGSMLTRWHYIALAAPLILFALELRRLRRTILVVLFIAIILAALQSFIDLRIRSIRNQSTIPVSQLSPQDPVRRSFGALHGASMALLLMQALAAAIVVAAKAKKEERLVRIDKVEPVPVVPLPRPDDRQTVVTEPEETGGGGP